MLRLLRKYSHLAHVAWRSADEAHRRHGRSRAATLWEQAVLFGRRGVDLNSYQQYRLFEPGRSREEKARYLSEANHVAPRLWSLLAPPRYRVLYENKLVFHHFFRAAGLPVATMHGVFDAGVGRATDGAPLRTVGDLHALLRRVGGAGFVFKPLGGTRGDRVLVFRGAAPDAPDVWLTLAGERYDVERLVAVSREGAGRTTFLVEERLAPHPALATLLGPTLCTVRMQTLVNRAGDPELVAAVFKLQPGDVGVDHLLHGAIGCWVDAETGALGRGRSRSHHDDVTTIPGTAREFVGYQLPDWAAARNVALRAAAVFPWVRSIGWDVALSERGPILIEGNDRWSPSLIQKPAPRGLMTGELAAVRDELERTRRRSRPAPESARTL